METFMNLEWSRIIEIHISIIIITMAITQEAKGDQHKDKG